MVAGQDQHVVRTGLVDLVHVVADSVGGAQVPAAVIARHVRLEDPDPAAAHPVQVPRPPRPDVVDERARVVLRQHQDAVDVRVDAVGQAEIDQAVLPAERDRRLRADRGQGRQPLPGSTRKDHREDTLHGSSLPTCGRDASHRGGAPFIS